MDFVISDRRDNDLEGMIQDILQNEISNNLRPSKIREDLQTYDLLKNEAYQRLEGYHSALE